MGGTERGYFSLKGPAAGRGRCNEWAGGWKGPAGRFRDLREESSLEVSLGSLRRFTRHSLKPPRATRQPQAFHAAFAETSACHPAFPETSAVSAVKLGSPSSSAIKSNT